MTYGIQQAYYLNAQNPSDLKTLLDVAVSIGLDSSEFEQLMLSSKVETALNTELELVRSIHVYSYPSLVLQLDAETCPVKLDYNSAQTSLLDIASIRSSHHI